MQLTWKLPLRTTDATTNPWPDFKIILKGYYSSLIVFNRSLPFPFFTRCFLLKLPVTRHWKPLSDWISHYTHQWASYKFNFLRKKFFYCGRDPFFLQKYFKLPFFKRVKIWFYTFSFLIVDSNHFGSFA